MTRLVFVDAARRYGAGLVLLVLAGSWLWRSVPPPVIRRWLWALSPGEAALAGGAGWLAYVGLTRPLARLVVRSARLEYWRQFPIARRQWRALHLGHGWALNIPFTAMLVYLLRAPDDPVAASAVPSVFVRIVVPILGSLLATAVTIAAQAATTRVPPTRRIGGRPRRRGPARTFARLSGWAVWRKHRTTAIASLGLQGIAGGLAILGSWHVAPTHPEDAAPLLRTTALLGGLLAGWPTLLAARALDRDRWFVDTLGVRPRDELIGRLRLGASWGTITVAATATATLGIALATEAPLVTTVVRGAGLGAAGVGFGAAAFVRIAAASEAKRDLHGSRAGSVFAYACGGGLVLLALGPWALAVAATVVALRACRAIVAAADTRQRLQTSREGDDHE